MNEILAPLLSLLLLYKYAALFLIIFFSALALPLPDNTVLLAAGAFASQGYFSFWISFASVFLGNVAGDCAGYFLARRYGKAVIGKLHVRTPWYIDRLEKYIRTNPRRTVFLTRFVGSADCIANLFAGFIGVPFSIFLLWDALGNAVSLLYVLAIGYEVGIYWMSVSSVLSIVGWIFVILIVLAVLVILMWYRPRT